MLPSSVHQLSVGNSNPTPKIYTQTRDKRHNRLSLVCVCPDVLVSVRIALSLSPVPSLFPCSLLLPRRKFFPCFPCVVSSNLWFLRPFLPRRKFIARFACVVSWFPSACFLLLPRRKILCRFPCVVSSDLWFLRSFLPRRKFIARFACVVSWFPSACALLLPRRKVLCRLQVFVLCFVCLLLIIAYNDCKVVLGNTMHLPICSFDRLCLARSDSAIFMHLDT